MHYKPYSPEWHRYRYLKEALDKYLDDYVENDIIMEDILDIICVRQEAAHAEYHKLEDERQTPRMICSLLNTDYD